MEAFGNEGALLFSHGHSQTFRARLPDSVQLLDAGPFHGEVFCGELPTEPIVGQAWLTADFATARGMGLASRAAYFARGGGMRGGGHGELET